MAGDSTIRIVPWRPEFRAAFERLNREWIETWFTLEAADLEVFRDPESVILATGGTILFALEGEEVVGTCAVLRHDAHTWELAKMAVSPAARGRGTGRRLGEAAIAFARSVGARRLMLVSNSVLAPALGLYRALGFLPAQLPAGVPYSRADVCMELALEGAPVSASP